MVPISSLITSSTLAAQVEIYTQLVCKTHKPDIFYDQAYDSMLGSLNAKNTCSSDPTVNEKVARLAASPYVTREDESTQLTTYLS